MKMKINDKIVFAKLNKRTENLLKKNKTTKKES